MIAHTFNHIKEKVVACCESAVSIVLRNHRSRGGKEDRKDDARTKA